MARISLRAAFTLAPGSAVSAQQVFTDRVTEVGAFDAALGALTASLATGPSPVTDRGVPRANVLAYFGVGGIGKTTLSEELERRFAGPDGADATRERAVIRFDFADSASFDMESYVLRLRAGLGHLAPTWHAFDVAFSVYWERAHPGESLDEFITRDSALRRVARHIGLSDQIASTLTDAFGSALPGVGRAAQVLGGLLYTHARRAVIGHRVLRDCDLLGELIEADADIETLSYFPYLLAWELARLPAPHPKVMVLWDTFEEVTSRSTREMERLLQRSAFLMPNVLFVVTGRNRLDWADLTQATELDFAGPKRWPFLQAGHNGTEPRQHLVGYLSPTDAETYLAGALTRGGQPVIPDSIRQKIAAASGGLPLYLDLAVTTYLDLLSRGETPVDDNFGQPLPEVCGKVLRDLGPDERNLLRAAALLDTFDPAMLRAACPHVPDSALTRFTSRPFLDMDPNRTWPYSLHPMLRDAIRKADTDLPDSWSARERTEAAARIGDFLHHTTIEAAAGDRSTQAAAIAQAVALCQLTGSLFDWLPQAAQQLMASGGWGLLPDYPAVGSGPVPALILGLQGARERRSGNLTRSISLLDDALGQPGVTPSLNRFLLLHRAHSLRVAGRYADAASDYRRLEQESGDFGDDARYWLADYSFLQGRFGDALTELDQITSPSPELRGEILRLRGHVHRVNAHFDQAEARYREALDVARDTSNPAAEGKALTDLMQTLAWHRPAGARDLRDRAMDINQALRNQVEVVKIRAATAVALANLGDLAAADAEIQLGLTLTEDCGYPGGRIWCQVARTLTQIRGLDTDASRASAARVAAIVEALGGNRFWSEIVTWWTGLPSAGTSAWLDGPDATRVRWEAVRDAGAHSGR